MGGEAVSHGHAGGDLVRQPAGGKGGLEDRLDLWLGQAGGPPLIADTSLENVLVG